MAKLTRTPTSARAMLGLATLLIATPANAGPYLLVWDIQEAVGFLDLGSVKAVEKERWVWVIGVAKETPSQLPDHADVVAMNIRFDCAHKQMQLLGSNRFRPDQTPIELDTKAGEVAPVPPGTAFARMLEAACDGKIEKWALIKTPTGFSMFDLSASVKQAPKAPSARR